ncbi:prolyl oligopeptidase family-domain-containing protein [Spinellus fusiger]|nr:prolyl oligopeptidase family-domain-containing protein [Spinellus fusiger]
MSIRKVLLSPEHTIFAYNTEREGMEYGELHFKDLQDRPQWQVYLHRIGTHQEEDVLVYEEKEDTVFVDITSTKDKKFITINCNSLSSSEARVIDATLKREQGQPPTLRRIKARVPGLEYYADHHGSTFYLLTNAHGATNFKLVRFPDTLIEDAVWEDVITMKETDKIEDVDLFQNFIVVYGRREGLPIILCYDVTTRTAHTVDLPEQFCVISPGTNLDFTTDSFRFSLSSPFTHESTYEYDMTHRQLKPIRIPHMQGRNPVLMRSYGAYGISTEPDFRIEHFPLLERGWVIALAHVSFKDFISVAEHLVHTKVTSPSSMAAVGTSAGGLLVGAMLHMRPDLFKALVLKVPFVDPLSAMLNPNLPLTQVEYPEWGNPTLDKTTYEYIQDYSPYENVEHLKTTCPMPSVFITAGLKDQRVSYWQPLKLVARLRHALGKESSRRLFLKVDLDKGHFGSGVEQEARLAEAAEQVAFLVSQVQS